MAERAQDLSAQSLPLYHSSLVLIPMYSIIFGILLDSRLRFVRQFKLTFTLILLTTIPHDPCTDVIWQMLGLTRNATHPT